MEEGLKLALANLLVYIHPSKANSISEAILVELNSLLFKFNEKFDGVVLAFEANVTEHLAKILPGLHPYLGVKVEAELLLFHPRPDMVLEGEVVKISEQSIHVVVLGFSAAVIADADIGEEFQYKVVSACNPNKHGKEIFRSNADRTHKIKVGSVIRFLVKSFDEEVLHITGSLLPAHTGCVKWLERHLEELPQSKCISKKRKNTEETTEVLVHDKAGKDGETFAAESNKTNKKSKRRKGESK